MTLRSPTRSRSAFWCATALLLCVSGSATAQSQTVTLQASKDNTLFDLNDQNQYLSNGAGDDLFTGMTDRLERRRAVIAFDLSSIPAGSTVTSVTLTLRLSRTRAANETVTLHRLTADWGEGTSDSTSGGGGQGATPTAGDATWIHRFFSTLLWTTPGGDFVATPSGFAVIGGQNGPYAWTGAGLTGDVQDWLNAPATNFGWLVKGNEAAQQTAMRFDSSENGTLANRPVLSVTFTPPGNVGACCLASGSCTVVSSATCASLGGVYQGDGTACSPNPCPQPTGACCLAGQVCMVMTSTDCSAQAGSYLGDGSACSPNPCTGTGQQTFVAVRDNTMYESATGALSNGAGIGVFAGTSDNPILRRRGLVEFDLSSLPATAVVTDARLRLTMSFTQATGPQSVGVHRANASWGEGVSNASGNETGGAASTTNDATWIHRFFNTVLWGAVGGDFAPTPSAALVVSTTNGTFEWTSPGLIADVQAWVSSPASNRGWVIVGDESIGRTQRRFDSREVGTPATRPQLIVSYSIPLPTGACCFTNGTCQDVSASQCGTLGGVFRGEGTMCSMESCPIVLTPYLDPLPLPGIAQPVSGMPGGAAHYDIAIREVFQTLHSQLPPTRVWGYAGSYPGPTIEARHGQTVTVQWRNDLRVFETQQLRTTHVLAIDECLHGPNMTGQVPVAVVHVHGAKDDPISDGPPEATFPPGGSSPVAVYPNDQPAATIWYHDHALGITRLNVYMGMAGFFLVRDAEEDALNIPRGEFEIGMAIQDRSFNPDGSLKYPAMWHEHFFGDFLLVNGKVWPYLNVKQGKYRFRLLNGSTSRAYTLALSNGATFWQIGSDTGLLEAPVAMTQVTITPGERADVVMDFAPYPAGTALILTNSAPAPFPNGPSESIIPNVMKFVVQAQAGDTDPLPSSLVPVPRIPESESVMQRDFELARGPNADCPQHADGMWMINGLMWDDITEFPRIGTTEVWAWVNRSGIVHPMHMHLVSFQVLDRQDFDVLNGVVTPIGPRFPPAANEMGWKDTVQATPNQITRVIARFDGFPGRYPYHCHILEHEDHEMMRQFEVLCDSPAVLAPPTAQQVAIGGTALFTLTASGDIPAYRWRRDGVELSDGPLPGGGVISGADTAVLSIEGVGFGDEGAYDCLVTNPCGAATSTGAGLDVTPAPCLGDLNADGQRNTADLVVFLGVFGTAVTPGATGDLNGDGVVNTADLAALLGVFGTACP